MSLRSTLPLLAVLAAFLFALAALPSRPAAAADDAPVDTEKVKRLLEQLQDKDAARRDAAVKELIKLGPDVLPLLPDPDPEKTTLVPQQRQALTGLFEKLRALQAARLTTGKPVTLKEDGISVEKALAELKKQTGIEVEDSRQNKDEGKLKLNLNGVTFWQALDAVAREADARVSLYENADKIALVDGPFHAVPTSYHGIFRTCLKRLQLTQDLENGAHVCVATLEVAWEPGFRPFFLELKPESLTVQDDKKHDLDVPANAGGREQAGEARFGMQLNVSLPAPPRTVLKFSSVKGKLILTGPSKWLTFTFPTLGKLQANRKDRKMTKEGVSVELSTLDLPDTKDDVWKIEATLEYPPGGPKFESFESWLVYNEIYLEKDGSTDRFPNNAGYTTGGGGENRASITYHFADDREKRLVRGKAKDSPWRVVYRAPGPIIELPIPFEFTDLELP
jgi:hypothetical protein